MARITVNTFPIQKLPISKKNKEWGEDCVDYIIGLSSLTNPNLPDNDEMQENYDLYNGIYNEKNLKYVTNPFNQDDGSPASAHNMNVIRPNVDLMLGEETKRPFNIQVTRTSDIAGGEVQESAKQMLLEYIQATVISKLGPEQQAQYQQALQSGEIVPPEVVTKYLTKDYKDITEITAYHTCEFLRKKLNLDNEFLKGWKDALIAGREIYYIGIRNGGPVVIHINPKHFWFELSEDLEFIHESEKVCHKTYMSVSQLYDKYFDKIDGPTLDKLLELTDQRVTGGTYKQGMSKIDNYQPWHVKSYNTLPDRPWTEDDLVAIYHTCWRSYKQIYFVTLPDPETGMPVTFETDEFYKKTGYEISIEKEWIIENWEGYRAGNGESDDDIYFGIQPIDYQYIGADKLNADRLPYTGTIYSNTNSKSKSLVSVMKPLQYLYIVIWYRLELAIAKDRGKIPVMDITQIPKSMNIDPAKWMHYLTALGVAFVNPYEEGWDIPGREGGKPSAFNQMTSWDLSMANTIVQYIQLLDKIETMVGQISGISEQRKGAISSNELVGNVERSVLQSAHITEPLFWAHNQVKKEVMTMLLNVAKHAWKDTGKTYLNYILDDATRAFVKLTDEFLYEDHDIFLVDGTREKNILEQIRALIQPAMQNGASLADAAEIYMTDNVSMIKSKLEEIEQARQQREQDMQERQTQSQEQIAQMEQEARTEELRIREAELDLKKYQIDTDATTKITVAQLNAYRGTTELDQDANGIPDPIEIGKNAIAAQKMQADAMAKELELTNKQREAENKREIENKKLQLERDKMASQEKIQKMKDDSALEREKIKARTAVRNKVSGEK